VKLSREDAQLAHDAVGMAVTLYDAVDSESGVPSDAPLYGKRDRLVELARRFDHEANCVAPGEREGQVTRSGHEVGAIYEDTYWGGAYAVLGETESGEIEVEQVVKGRAGRHHVVGDRWTHRTALDHCSRKIGYRLNSTTHDPEEGC
jgi:hypothetical protein